MKQFTASAALAGLGIGLCAVAAQAQDTQSYRADLVPMNDAIAAAHTTGEATFTVDGDDLKIHIAVTGAPPGIEHLQHFHGFAAGGGDATCPTISADANGDAIIDLIETEPDAGTTMVPFQADPVDMQVVTDTYPKADDSGAYTYDKTVSLSALQDAFAKAFDGQALDLDRRVVFIHGIPASTELPDTVASLGDIPAQVTLPIACGEITAGS